MRFLVLATDYPNKNNISSLAYIRTRCVYYKEHGIDVDILNFTTNVDYEMDGIKIYSLKGYKSAIMHKHYDLLISHAPNLRNHYVFLLKYGKKFHNIIFFYHGHEVLKINKVYPKPYPWVHRNVIKEKLQDIYDIFKLFIWRKYINNHHKKIYYFFVSNWMRNEFIKWVHPKSCYLDNHNFIVYNSVDKIFETETYNLETKKEFDFVTIRAGLDGSKYAIDIVNELATKYPNKKFLLIGKGAFFRHVNKANNITWLNKDVPHKEIPHILNSAKCALMPTRTDAQGVMMCEMATFGMPLITSDISVCHEVFDGFNGVGFISNINYLTSDLISIYDNIKDKARKKDKYFNSILGEKELSILKSIVKYNKIK